MVTIAIDSASVYLEKQMGNLGQRFELFSICSRHCYFGDDR